MTGTFGFKFMQLRYPGRESSFFLLPAQLDCIDLAKPIPSAKVNIK